MLMTSTMFGSSSTTRTRCRSASVAVVTAGVSAGLLRSSWATPGSPPHHVGSRTMPDDREYDIVLLGATGYTGGLTAQYLARHAPEGTRWALAGRNRDKLAAVAERLGTG